MTIRAIRRYSNRFASDIFLSDGCRELQFPTYPKKQTFAVHQPISALAQSRTDASPGQRLGSAGKERWSDPSCPLGSYATDAAGLACRFMSASVRKRLHPAL